MLHPDMDDADLLRVIASSKEFEQIKVPFPLSFTNFSLLFRVDGLGFFPLFSWKLFFICSLLSLLLRNL